MPRKRQTGTSLAGASCYIFVVVLLLTFPLDRSVHAGVVLSRSARQVGDVRLTERGVSINKKTVAWNDVAAVQADPSIRTLPRPLAVRFAGGECWSVRRLTFASDTLTVESELLGERQMKLTEVRSLEFAGIDSDVSQRKSKTLYRRQGEPVPGQLLWIDSDKLGLESPLGTLTLPRESLVGYEVTAQKKSNAPAEGLSEIILVDGTVIHGAIQIAGEELRIAHGQWGQIVVPVGSVRSIVQHSESVRHLATRNPVHAELRPLIAESPGTLSAMRPITDTAFVRGLRLEAGAIVRYELAATESAQQFRALLLPVARANGAARFVIRADGKTVLDEPLAPLDKERLVSCEIGTARTLELDVSFGEPLGFPVGVVLGDPHLLIEGSR